MLLHLLDQPVANQHYPVAADKTEFFRLGPEHLQRRLGRRFGFRRRTGQGDGLARLLGFRLGRRSRQPNRLRDILFFGLGRLWRLAKRLAGYGNRAREKD